MRIFSKSLSLKQIKKHRKSAKIKKNCLVFRIFDPKSANFFQAHMDLERNINFVEQKELLEMRITNARYCFL